MHPIHCLASVLQLSGPRVKEQKPVVDLYIEKKAYQAISSTYSTFLVRKALKVFFPRDEQ